MLCNPKTSPNQLKSKTEVLGFEQVLGKLDEFQFDFGVFWLGVLLGIEFQTNGC